MTLKSASLAALLVAGLSACNGSGTNLPELTDAELEARVDGLTDSLDDVEDVTPFASLPTTGDATYEGVIVFADDFDNSITGPAEVGVDFADGAFSGVGGNFLDQDGADAPGTIDITDGIIMNDGGDAMVEARFEGEVTVGDTVVTIDLPAVGGFGGTEADVLIVEADGNVDAGGEPLYIFGGFLGEK